MRFGKQNNDIFVSVSLTSVVVLGAVAQLLLVLHDELRQRQAVGHLHRAVLQPLEHQVIHGVPDWTGGGWGRGRVQD